MGITRISRRAFLRLFKDIGLVIPLGRFFERMTPYKEGAVQEAPVGLLCDLKANPMGIEAGTPHFSWIVGYAERDEWQTAYQILVKLAVTGETIWDSGKVLSAESSNVGYGGVALQSGCVYDWQVRTWNKLDVPSAYSAPQMFATTLDSPWQAVPIWSGSGSFACLRRQITLPSKPISAAIAYVTGNTTDRLLGAYRLYVNAHWVGTGPGRGCSGNFPYDVYDVTQWLTAGPANVVAAQGYAESDGKFLLQLKVFYQDGTEDVFVTDDQWKAIDVDTVYNPTGSTASYYTQPHEYIDARNFQVGWQSVGFDDSSWSSAVERSALGSLAAKPTYPLEIHEQSPAAVVQKAPGDYIFDFGQEIMGGIRLSLAGSAGQVMELRLGEELSSPNTVMYNLRTGNVFRDYWTLRGGSQTIEHHEYLEFRYGEVLNSPQPLDADDIKAWVVRYPFDDGESDFDSSSPALNDVWDFCKYTIKATTLDVYTDSNVRERGPYEGDAYVNALSHYAVAKEFLIQRYTTAFLLENPTWPTEWPICSVLMAHADYMATGDPCLAEQYYTLLKANTLQGLLNADNLIQKSTTDDLVDWPSNMRDGFVFTTINTVVNAYACRAMQLMAELARAIGEDADADQFEADALALKSAMHTYLFNGTQYKDGRYTPHVSLHANMFPLAFDLVPSDDRASVAALIVSKGMVCSPYGAQFLLEALYNAGENEVALGFMTATTGNSWIDMVNRGATTTCEAWNYDQKSNMTWSHPWGTVPSNVIPRYLMGVQPLSPGYGCVRIKPQPGSLEWASLDIPTIKGTIHVEFAQEPQAFTLRVTLPANTRARVYLPKLDIDDALVWVDGALQNGVIDGSYVYLDDVGSGTHEFIRMPTERTYLPLIIR